MTPYARRLRHRVLREQDYQFWLAEFFIPPFLIGQMSDRRDTWWTREEYSRRRRTRIWDGPTHERIYRKGVLTIVPIRRPGTGGTPS